MARQGGIFVLGLSYARALNDFVDRKATDWVSNEWQRLHSCGYKRSEQKNKAITPHQTPFSQHSEDANKVIRAQESAYRGVGTVNSITCVYKHLYIVIDPFFCPLFFCGYTLFVIRNLHTHTYTHLFTNIGPDRAKGSRKRSDKPKNYDASAADG